MTPDDFTAFVADYGPRIARACAEVTGNDRMAEALRDDMLAAVAGRWRRWPAASRTDRALARIRRLLRREARAHHAVLHPSALDLRPSLRLRTVPFGSDPDQPQEDQHRDGAAERLAASAWGRSARGRRMWWTGAGVAALAALTVALLLPPAPAPEPPLPTDIPAGVTLLPDINELMPGLTGRLGLPPYLALGPSDVDALPSLAEAPLLRATMVTQANGYRLVVVGDEIVPLERVLPPPQPQRRRVEHPALQGARLVATSLSPDGMTVALPYSDGLVLVDVRTGQVRTVEVAGAQDAVGEPVLTWLDATRVLLPGVRSQVVNVATDDVTPVDIDGYDVLSLRGYLSPRLAQLVAVPPNPDTTDGPHIIRSLLLLWRDMDAAGNVEPAAGAGQVGVRYIVTGPPWFSAWTGPGFASPGLVVRACDPTTLLLPREAGRASGAVAAIDGNGNGIGTLVAVGGDRLDALGVVRAERDLALVAVRAEGRSMLVAWDPYADTLDAVTYLTADAQLSVADLAAQCSSCSRLMVMLDQETNAVTPVSASPTTS